MQNSKHVFRALFLIIIWGIVFLVVRGLMIPDSYGEFGHYRGDNVAEQRAKSPVHGRLDSCDSCHAKQAETIHRGKHSTVPCQDCHAPLNAVNPGYPKEPPVPHTDGNKKKTAAMPVNRKARLCERCHEKLESKPKGFPQVVPAEHLQQVGGEDGDEACVNCHTPHDPKL